MNPDIPSPLHLTPEQKHRIAAEQQKQEQEKITAFTKDYMEVVKKHGVLLHPILEFAPKGQAPTALQAVNTFKFLNEEEIKRVFPEDNKQQDNGTQTETPTPQPEEEKR